MPKRFVISVLAFALLAALPAAISAATITQISWQPLGLRWEARGCLGHGREGTADFAQGQSLHHVFPLLRTMHSRLCLRLTEYQRWSNDYRAGYV